MQQLEHCCGTQCDRTRCLRLSRPGEACCHCREGCGDPENPGHTVWEAKVLLLSQRRLFEADTLFQRRLWIQDIWKTTGRVQEMPEV